MDVNDTKKKLQLMNLTEDQKYSMILTHLGLAGQLAQFISETIDPVSAQVPLQVVYCMAMTASNLQQFIVANPNANKFKLVDLESQPSEQQEEQALRKIKYIVSWLNKSVAEQDKV